jgi:ElaB/YqjD/DUF883 family membrane-anchored ribosome-binding protein
MVMPVRRRRVVSTLLGLCAVLVVCPAEARRGRRRFRSRGSGTGVYHGKPVLSREALRECVARQDELSAASAELERMEASLAAETAGIDELNALIERREALVNRYSQQSVDEFNALVDRQRRAVHGYNEKLSQMNERFAAHNRSVDLFNANCADREYYEDDMQAVLSGR